MSAEDHVKKCAATLACIRRMEEALGANSNTMEDHFHEDFTWSGNQGCGTKSGLAEFRANWQLPLRAAFTERECITQKFLADGDWASCYEYHLWWL